MTVVLTQGYRSGVYGHQYYYEDVRNGHNIGYLGDGKHPVNSITFVPIFGPEPQDYKTTSGQLQTYAGSSYSPEFEYSGNGTVYWHEYMRLGNTKVPQVMVYRSGGAANAQDHFGNVLPFNWVSCVPDEQPVQMSVGNDDGADKYVHWQNGFYGLGGGYYSYYCNLEMNDGDEIWSKLPAYSTTSTSTNGVGGGFAHSYKTGGSASYRGFHEISYLSGASYHAFLPYVNFKRNGTSTVTRYTSFGTYRNLSYLGTYGGYPYYLEISLGQYEGSVSSTVACKAFSYNVDTNTMTQVANLGFATASYSNLSYANADPNQHNSGTADGYWKGPTKWMLAQGGSYRWLMFPTYGTRDYPCHNCVRMDTSTYAIQYAGTNGQQPNMYSYGDGQAAYNDFEGTGTNVSDLGGTQSTTGQPGLAAAYMDWHGVYDVNTGEYFGPDYLGTACTNGSGIVNQLHSIFPAYGTAGRADAASDARHRRIQTWRWKDEPNSWTSGANGSGMNWGGFTTVPETPQQWCWLDEKRTLIAAIGQNNTYIYECRGYNVEGIFSSGTTNRSVYYIGNTNTTGADAGSFSRINAYNSAYTVPGFNGNPTAQTGAGSFMGWVHVNTIPHKVVNMGIDKHGKIFAVTANITALGGTNGYGGNLHMWTMNTPFSVALAGNITTDTITYAGSNIDKTLTIEAIGIRGRRVKSSVQLEIVGTDAQFDNGTQSKTVTTSTGGTVSETVTITGSSQFNIIANFGV
jgi:hypothetical protein